MKSKRLIIAGILVLILAFLGLYLLAGNQPATHQTASTGKSWDTVYVPSRDRSDATAGATAISTDAAGDVTFSNVTLEDAVRGAIVGDYFGLNALQSYLDAALGDHHALERLAERIMDALGQSPIRNDYEAMATATRRLSDAVASSLSAAYRLPYERDVEEGLPRYVRGWDFGTESRAAPRGFVKIFSTSREVDGKSIQLFELERDQPLFGDGLAGVESFAAPIEDGLYRVYLLSARRPDGQNPTYPFGDGVRTNGRALRIVDAAETFKGSEIRFTTDEIATFAPPSALESGAFAPRQINYGPDGDEAGLVLATRALVHEGTFLLEFDIPEGAETYIVGIVVETTDLGEFEDEIDQQIATLLAGTEPASGTGDGEPGADAAPSPFVTAFLPPGTEPSAGISLPGFRGGPGGGYSGFGASSTTSSGGSSSGGSSSGGRSSSSSSSSSGGFPGGSTSGGFGGGPSGGPSGSSASGGGSSSSGGSSTSSGSDIVPQDENITPAPSSSSGGNENSCQENASEEDNASSSGGNDANCEESNSSSGGDDSSSSSSSSTSGGDGSSTSGGDGSSSSSSSSSTSGGDASSTGGDSSSTGGGSSTSSSSTSSGAGSSSTSTSSGSSTSSGAGSSTTSTSGGASTSGGDGSTSSSSSGGGSSTSGGDSSSGGDGPHIDEYGLTADAGDDLFGFTGENFLIDGCGSMFEDLSLCDMADESLEDFSIIWKWNEITVATDTLEFLVETGGGSLFDTVGEYLITLEIIYRNEFNTLRAGDGMTLSLLRPRLIASPGGFLLILAGICGLGYLRWRKFWA